MVACCIWIVGSVRCISRFSYHSSGTNVLGDGEVICCLSAPVISDDWLKWLCSPRSWATVKIPPWSPESGPLCVTSSLVLILFLSFFICKMEIMILTYLTDIFWGRIWKMLCVIAGHSGFNSVALKWKELLQTEIQTQTCAAESSIWSSRCNGVWKVRFICIFFQLWEVCWEMEFYWN